MAAEIVLCLTRVKGVTRQVIFTTGYRDRRCLDNEMLIPGHATDAAIAIMQIEIVGRLDCKCDATTVT